MSKGSLQKEFSSVEFEQMSSKSNIRRVVVFLCLALFALAALTPGAAGLALAFLVVTICFFDTISIILTLLCTDEESHSQQAFALAVFSPRPPPTLQFLAIEIRDDEPGDSYDREQKYKKE